MVVMEGNALSWFQWWEMCNRNQSWFSYKNAFIQRFQPVLMGDPFELLLAPYSKVPTRIDEINKLT